MRRSNNALPPRTPQQIAQDIDLSLRVSSAAGIADAEMMEQNLQEWLIHSEQARKKRYQIIAAPICEPMARRLQAKYPERFRFHPTHWGKFPDGTDNIEVGGFQPHNVMAGEHVLLLASFHNNDVTLSQFQVSAAVHALTTTRVLTDTLPVPMSPHFPNQRINKQVMVMLLQNFIASLTVVLPFYPVGTMERVVKEGQVGSPACLPALSFSLLPIHAHALPSPSSR